jgi:phosphoglycerate dehydrogenase-like enzyme
MLPPHAVDAAGAGRPQWFATHDDTDFTAMPEKPPVGLIGLGLMGEALAYRLIGAGMPVIGYDIDPARTARLAALGA